MKTILEKTLQIGGYEVLKDAQLFYRILEDIAPNEEDFISWFKQNYDTKTLRNIYDNSNQNPNVLNKYFESIIQEYSKCGNSTVRNIDISVNIDPDDSSGKTVDGSTITDNNIGDNGSKDTSKQVVKSKVKSKSIIGLVLLCIIVICGTVAVRSGITAREYKRAFELVDAGDYVAAYEAFGELGDYKNSLAERKDIKEDHPLYFKDVGDEIVFGTYPQTAEGRSADIEWIILEVDRDNHHLMLISKYALERRAFHDINENISWADSTLRFWLNNEFIKEAFSGFEKRALLTHQTEARDNWEYGTPGGEETTNKVYLLDLKNFDDLLTGKPDIAKCVPTEYAIKQGADVEGDYCNWWLRSPGEYQNYAAIVDTQGGFINSGRGVSNDTICVRPVIWVDISVLDKN